MSEQKTKDWEKVRQDIEQSLQDEADRDADDVVEAPAAPDAIADYGSLDAVVEKLKVAEHECHQLKEQLLRVRAEADNIRRRAQMEVEKERRYGNEKCISAILPVADSLEQGLQIATTAGDQAMCEGMSLTLKLLHDALERLGVSAISPEGALFDPQEHEAMSMQEKADVEPNTVIAVFQKGYRLADRVIRPARVVVARGVK